MKIKLNNKEKNLLERAVKDNTLFPSYKISLNQHSENYVLESDEDNITDLRECCSDYLMIVGFEENYEPNEEGIILENLIDKLFTG